MNNIFLDFKNSVLKTNYFADEDFKSYQRQSFKQKLISNEFFFKNKNKLFYMPYTILKKNGKDFLSFYSLPAHLFSNNKIDLDDVSQIKKELLKINPFLSFKFTFVQNFSPSNLDSLLKINPYLIQENQFIDLSRDDEELFKNLKNNHKYEIKKALKNKNLSTLILNQHNYKDGQIFQMMEMHKLVSGKKTRSKKSWNLMEIMIKRNKGFLVQVNHNNQVISYSFFIYNSSESFYLSSVTLRNKFNIAGINHLTLWSAITYAKNKLSLSRFKLGVTKYVHSRNLNEVDKKKENIAFFKSRFGGNKDLHITVDEYSYI